MAKNKALGRGLDALIPSFEPDESVQSVDIRSDISISNIKANPYQPRRQFSEEELEELTCSIRENGLITPITVTPDGNSYILIAGERRLRACTRLDYDMIPAYVRKIDSDEELMELALIENVQRENLNPIEEAMAYKALIERYKLSQDDVAERIGKKRSTITNTLRLLKLPDEIQDSLAVGEISQGHARALLSAEREQTMLEWWKQVIEKRLSVRETEQLGKKNPLKKKPRPEKETLNPFLESIQNNLQRNLGTNVKIRKKNDGGFIEIKYYSQQDLERILDLLEKENNENG